MTGPESKRLDLYNRLREVLGTDPATTLMTYLPPVLTPDLITRAEFKTEMHRIDKRIDRVLLAVVAGNVAILATIIGTTAL